MLGDLRVSIGPCQGKPTVVVYGKEAADKHPKLFSSGVVKGYEMKSVVVLSECPRVGQGRCGRQAICR